MTLFGNRVLQMLLVKMRSFWSEVGSKCNMTGALMRKRKKTHRGEGHIKVEAEVAVIHL